jgi:hypothetical protein
VRVIVHLLSIHFGLEFGHLNEGIA